MKLLVVFALFALAAGKYDPETLDPETFDWSTVKPLRLIKEYREAYPKLFIDTEPEVNEEVFNPLNRNRRILDGSIAGPTDFPWIAGILISFEFDNGWCSGSLVSRNYVLSAAQCLVGLDTRATVMLDASDISRFGEVLMVWNYIKHPAANDDLDHDVALLRLQRAALITERVQVIRLPNLRQTELSFENQKVHVAGWGTTGTTVEAIPVQNLRGIQASVITNLSCRIRYIRLRDFNLCTDLEEGSPCTGDEGSPLTTVEFDYIPTQIALFSYVSETRIRGCQRGWPPVYTRLTPYLLWIQENSDVLIRSGFD